MKVVLDANVYISSLISEFGNPHQIIDRWLKKEFEVLITSDIIAEVGRVLRYPRIVKRHQLDEPDIVQFVEMLARFSTPVEPIEPLDEVPEDESDNRYLECAIAGNADYIVTGDEHLLGLQSFQGIFILNPAEFVAMLAFTEGRNSTVADE